MTPEMRERIERVKHDIAHAFLPRVADVQALIAALKAAAPVAEAVEWCAAHEAMVDWDSEGVQVSICNAKEGDDPFSAEDAMYKKCWPEEHAPDLPAAVAALRQRVEGK